MISHDRTADQSHEYLGCNDFFGQGSSTIRTIRVTSSSPLSRASLRLELRLIVFDDDVKKDMAPVFSCFVRSLE